MKHSGYLQIDPDGRVKLPPDLMKRLRLERGSALPYSEEGGLLHLGSSSDDLARVYVEPTSACNFDCLTCMRNAWDEPLGSMTEVVFDSLVEGLRAFSPLPLVFFGGFGEPLSHPDILHMIRAVKGLGAKVELITNGTLMDAVLARALVESGLDRLWVSIDGASPAGYADVRLGDALALVIENMERLGQIRREAGMETPRIGIAFVAMRRNIQQMPEVVRLGRRLGADRFSISNVLAHTPELVEEVLYGRSYYASTGKSISELNPSIELPRLEINELTGPSLVELLGERASLSFSGQPLQMGGNTCPFVEKRSLSVRWDGRISPCLPLLHGHIHYLDRTRRTIQPVSFGSLPEQSLAQIWHTPDYRALRERLMSFDFSPCVFCNSCEFAGGNQEDCFGNAPLTCGGCLWAQGFIRCP
jgi:MoaA/NifB/PqqE/SkfB family radical SAM enzyme